MKTGKLVSGILSIVFLLFQSELAGIANTMSANGEGESAGLFGLAALFGFTSAESYGDLYIWSFWCLINAALAVVALVKTKKSLKTT